jgi:ABC-type branched-subunit amino acid transport system ATPase component
MTAALQTIALGKHFGALHVTRQVNLSLDAGARHALIGPNGAGKTTLINLITGALPADEGQVLLGGRDVTALGQARRVKQGLARTYQINQLFSDLSVLENVAISVAERVGAAGNVWRRASANSHVIDEAVELLARLKLGTYALTPVRELPYGRQRLVEIAITLGQQPSVLLLDEPAAGVPSAESHIILDVIAALPEQIAVLIIEHDMDIVFRFAKFITVLASGGIIAQGTPEQIAGDAHVRAVYLGQGGDV